MNRNGARQRPYHALTAIGLLGEDIPACPQYSTSNQKGPPFSDPLPVEMLFGMKSSPGKHDDNGIAMRTGFRTTTVRSTVPSAAENGPSGGLQAGAVIPSRTVIGGKASEERTTCIGTKGSLARLFKADAYSALRRACAASASWTTSARTTHC